ncbi:hypothetical protein F444_22723 [Phytophthora nicotianae P1976]|uniref:Uncharacterized protein n=1 Tax=Phytophthora nicotianae P1976 TaxID=1317066 RepID=A0A080YWZ0_PHYNI|nr:hypothetical protein F444_22723 [Phytophthora nicotianae P1976]
MDNTEDMTADWDVDFEDELDTSMTDASGDGVISEGEEAGGERAQVLESEGEASGSRRMPNNIAEQYIAALKDQSSLHVAIADQVSKAYDNNAEYGFFLSSSRRHSRRGSESGHQMSLLVPDIQL